MSHIGDILVIFVVLAADLFGPVLPCWGSHLDTSSVMYPLEKKKWIPWERS